MLTMRSFMRMVRTMKTINFEENPEALTERFDKRHPTFQRDIKRLAEAAQLPFLTVFGLWLEYTEDCRNYDQSPLLSEFANWYSAFLTPLSAGK
jgi:hypothetical protein